MSDERAATDRKSLTTWWTLVKSAVSAWLEREKPELARIQGNWRV